MCCMNIRLVGSDAGEAARMLGCHIAVNPETTVRNNYLAAEALERLPAE